VSGSLVGPHPPGSSVETDASPRLDDPAQNISRALPDDALVPNDSVVVIETAANKKAKVLELCCA